MKAIVCRRYGPPDGLQLREVEKSSPKDSDQDFGTTTGLGSGAHAEYIYLPEDGVLAMKPVKMTYQVSTLTMRPPTISSS